MRFYGWVRAIAVSLLFLLSGKLLTAQNHRWHLGQCIDTAIAYSITLRQQAFVIEQNRIGLVQSRNNLLPTINGNFGEALSVGHMVNPVTGQYETGTVWSTTPSIGLSQNLFSGLQYLNAIQQSLLAYESSKLDMEDTKFNLSVSVVNAFLQVLYTSEATKIAAQQVAYDSAQYQTVANLEYLGKKTESDVLQVSSQLSADQYSLVYARGLWRIAKLNLQQLMNIPISEGFEIDYSEQIETQTGPPGDIGTIFAQSLLFQPVIRSYALKTQSAIYGLKAAKGGYSPQLMLKASLSTAYSSYAKQSSTTVTENIQDIGYLQSNPSELVFGRVPVSNTKYSDYTFGNQLNDNLSSSLSVGLSIPVLNYLQVRNNVRKQWVNVKSAELSEESTRLTLRKTIEQLYANVLNAEAQYQASTEEVRAGKAAYDISVVKFEEGKEIITDLLVQKNAYIKALSDYLQAKYGLAFNTRILDYYRGIPLSF